MTFTSPSFTVELEEEWFLSFPRYFKGTVVVFSSDSISRVANQTTLLQITPKIFGN